MKLRRIFLCALLAAVLVLTCAACGEKVTFAPTDESFMTAEINEKGDTLTYTVTASTSVQVTVFTFEDGKLDRVRMTHYTKTKEEAEFFALSLEKGNTVRDCYRKIKQKGTKVTAEYGPDMLATVKDYSITALKEYMEQQLY